jgi:hypothetical protein
MGVYICIMAFLFSGFTPFFFYWAFFFSSFLSMGSRFVQWEKFMQWGSVFLFRCSGRIPFSAGFVDFVPWAIFYWGVSSCFSGRLFLFCGSSFCTGVECLQWGSTFFIQWAIYLSGVYTLVQWVNCYGGHLVYGRFLI